MTNLAFEITSQAYRFLAWRTLNFNQSFLDKEFQSRRQAHEARRECLPQVVEANLSGCWCMPASGAVVRLFNSGSAGSGGRRGGSSRNWIAPPLGLRATFR